MWRADLEASATQARAQTNTCVRGVLYLQPRNVTSTEMNEPHSSPHLGLFRSAPRSKPNLRRNSKCSRHFALAKTGRYPESCDHRQMCHLFQMWTSVNVSIQMCVRMEFVPTTSPATAATAPVDTCTTACCWSVLVRNTHTHTSRAQILEPQMCQCDSFVSRMCVFRSR